ncbi:uncharacterized protein K460DRAFT_356589 [Cucurbitaria berberidis CBS 394.84]|uniref:Uncharacterized protein n=1 Tax=Cucurbitaria berberidis CBS 394.84 TaxID=1168544 RepID=A0A9P4GC94_9PLEO|nr:uncharacterized protein K460DRAFT_356589 [Cucurbitaria berberidis CBS 394.84]KAF1842772.1 hypothetical protein K460DRAFT_356589 [Cucurbitaria berberidis CBS 394.84]
MSCELSFTDLGSMMLGQVLLGARGSLSLSPHLPVIEWSSFAAAIASGAATPPTQYLVHYPKAALADSGTIPIEEQMANSDSNMEGDGNKTNSTNIVLIGGLDFNENIPPTSVVAHSRVSWSTFETRVAQLAAQTFPNLGIDDLVIKCLDSGKYNRFVKLGTT